ncbi:NAD(P)-dependent malic enzyme [Guggenheimella bovis]
MTIFEKSVEAHKTWRGKVKTELKCSLENKDDLSLAYTPGVAEPCRRIHKDPESVYEYTWKSNTVAVVSDGTAVLGLGDIGPMAALPVMEGKCALFKRFAGVDAVPIVLDTKDTEEIISICKAIAPTFGGINLEDISAPRCVEIETRLKEELNIPVFHDDQHGTSIVLAAALMNALKLVKKDFSECQVVLLGTGAAGSSIAKMLTHLGVKDIFAFRRKGIIRKSDEDNALIKELAEITNKEDHDYNLEDAMKEADIFIGVSGGNLITKDMVRSMKKDAIVFSMANPDPEITYDDAKEAGARVVGTGRSDYPNQVNNVLAFPGLFRGALDARAEKITEEMKLAAAKGLASLITEAELSEDYVIVNAFDERAAKAVAEAVIECKKAETR